MKRTLLLFFTVVFSISCYSQGYQVKIAKQPQSNPEILLDGQYRTPSTPSPSYAPPTPTYTANDIVFENKSYSIKTITIYYKEGIDWRVHGSYRIFEQEEAYVTKSGSEQYMSYGYVVEGSLITTITYCRQYNYIY